MFKDACFRILCLFRLTLTEKLKDRNPQTRVLDIPLLAPPQSFQQKAATGDLSPATSA